MTAPPIPIDLTAALFAQRSRPRGDEADAHIQDLYGCDRATWYRRNGEAPEPFTPAKLAQFAIGNGYERAVGDTLRDAGFDVRTGIEVTYRGLTGHPDLPIFVDDENAGAVPALVIETKTTEARKPKSEEVSPHYAVQVSGYALALAEQYALPTPPRAKVLVKYAGTHDEREWDVDPEAWRATIDRRAAEIHERTAPGAPMPPAEPDALAPWGCAYCDWRMCERNPNYEPAPTADDLLADFEAAV